jgi:hypothetical protein
VVHGRTFGHGNDLGRVLWLYKWKGNIILENGGDNAGKNGNEKATDEDERAEINTVKMKNLKGDGSGE